MSLAANHPGLTLRNRQRGYMIHSAHLRTLAAEGLTDCLKYPGTGDAPLPHLGTVDISLVSDRAIAELHVRFMNVSGATDVITFAHGEIVISAGTATRQAAEFGQDFHQELFRYIVHGLLHLNGHEDATEAGAAAMWRVQEELVASHWRPISTKLGTGR